MSSGQLSFCTNEIGFNRQLDQLDRLLDDLESKRDRIHLQARELLEDSRQVENHDDLGVHVYSDA